MHRLLHEIPFKSPSQSLVSFAQLLFLKEAPTEIHINEVTMYSKSLTHKLFCRKVFWIRIHKVTTWSPLGVAFNSLPGKRLELNFSKDNGLFGIGLLSSYKGFYPFKDRACTDADRLVREALSPARSRKMVDVFDDLSDTLCQVADLAEFIRVAHPDPQFRQAAETACLDINVIVETLNTNKSIYDSLKRVVDYGDVVPTTAVDDHVSKLFLFDFEQSGIHLPEEERKKVVALNEGVLNLGQYFMQHAANPRLIANELIPQSVRHCFSSDGRNTIINGLYCESPNELAREVAYRLYLHPDPHQEYLLNELLKARHKLAVICGFPTYAHRAIRSTVADTPEFVSSFLNKLNENLKPKAEEDLSHILKLKQAEQPGSIEVKLWDIGYYTNKIKKEYLKTELNEISSYFCLGACMEGINNLIQNLFGISLVCEEIKPKEVWSPDVYKLAVVHETEGLLGHIFCDFYQRNGKPNQDCHFTIRGGRELPDGTYQNPIVVLMLNLQIPQWSSPCLLSPSQLDNLAHEMGHALHSMLARTRHQHVTGTRCCTDFAEVPSILMEYFLSDPRVLKTFAKHFQTKEPMKDEIVKKLCNSKHLLLATETQTQVLYSALDQKLHGKYPLEGSTCDVFYETQSEFSVLKPVKNTAWQLRFSHLVGYGAKYYSYLLSRSIASCIWQTYFKEDPFSREQGERYRRECLSHGGGKPARQVLNDFLNKEATPETMASSLLTEIDQHQSLLQKI